MKNPLIQGRMLYVNALRTYRLWQREKGKGGERLFRSILRSTKYYWDPKITFAFDKNIDALSLDYLITNKVPAGYANQFIGRRFDGLSISELYHIRARYEDVFAFPEKYNGYGIAMMLKNKVTPHMASGYDERFSGGEIADLVSAKASPAIAVSYDRRFYGGDIAELYRKNVGHNEAAGYPSELSGEQIAIISEMGLTPDIVTEVNLPAIKSIFSFHLLGKKGLKFLASGASSIIIFDSENRRAYKCSRSLKHEVNALNALKLKHGISRNIINIESDLRMEIPAIADNATISDAFYAIGRAVEARHDRVFGKMIIALEYIVGESLETVLKNENLNPKQALIYVQGILSGLNELHEAGYVYHGDINPRNVMIDFEKNRAVLIDLEHAVSAKELSGRYFIQPRPSTRLVPEHIFVDMYSNNGNRRFNGPTDLSSLGQVWFYMLAGSNPFSREVPSSRDLSDIAEIIKHRRAQAYMDSSGKIMNEAYDNIDEKIGINATGLLIKKMLAAANEDFDEICLSVKRMLK